MNIPMRLFVYLYIIIVATVWSLLADNYIDYKQEWGMAASIVLIFASFGLNEERSCGWILLWVIGSSASLLLVFTWSGNYTIPAWISSSMLLLLALLHLGTILMLKKNFIDIVEQRATAFLFLGATIFLFLISLAADDITPPYTAYTFILYLYIKIALIDIWRLRRLFYQRKLRLFYVLLMWGLMSIFLILIARRWIASSTLPLYLIVQPLLGLASVQLIRYIRESMRDVKYN
jgi:hypothetical protein